MTYPNNAMRVGGAWLALASALMIAALAFHGPIAHDHTEQMARIANASTRWTVVHWLAAAALSLYAVAGILVLTSQSRFTQDWWTATAWAIVPVAALWTVTTAVAEATVVTNAAVSGNDATFAAWLAFAEGKANGFAVMALAVAMIAGNEAQRSDRITPTWAAWVTTVLGLLSFAGWALNMWFGVSIGALVWVASSILMSVWTLWFGVALMRMAAPAGQQTSDARKPVAA